MWEWFFKGIAYAVWAWGAYSIFDHDFLYNAVTMGDMAWWNVYGSMGLGIFILAFIRSARAAEEPPKNFAIEEGSYDLLHGISELSETPRSIIMNEPGKKD